MRTAVGLSAATGRACRIRDIRKGRRKPGLAAQHLTAVRAAARLCGAEMQGARMGSEELQFRPGPLAPPAKLRADVGTAGAVALVLQTVLAPLAVAGMPVEVTVTGGTHVAWAPTADFFDGIFCYYLRRLGVRVHVVDVRPGFYPKGGGLMRVAFEGAELTCPDWTRRGEAGRVAAASVATEDLSRARVAERQLDGAAARLPLDGESHRYVSARSTGSAIHITAEYANARLGASALGRRGKRAERVGRECADLLARQVEAGGCLDEHMADQILPYLALADGESRVSVAGVSDHCRTNIRVIESFLPVRFAVAETAGLIACQPA